MLLFTANSLRKVVFLAGLTAALGMAQSLTITTSPTLLAASTAVPYSQQLTATGGTPPYTWVVLAGSLPMGLTLSASGLISGQPSAIPPTPTFRVRVSDSVGAIAIQDFTLNVYPSPGSLLRTSVLAQLAAGAGWATTIYLVN